MNSSRPVSPVEPTDAQREAERVRPKSPALMRQNWEHLLFLHWSMEPAVIQATLPAGLTVDTFDGRAWVGLVPFYMNRIRPVGFPPVPWLSYFLELNVRTYAIDEKGRPGVWFYSLDCNRSIAVWTARGVFNLPYQHARMQAQASTAGVRFSCQRRGDAEAAHFDYAAEGAAAQADAGTLEFFLVERYRLFARRRNGRILTGQVHHAPYEISGVRLAEWNACHLTLAGLDVGSRRPEHVRYSRRVDVKIFAPGQV